MGDDGRARLRDARLFLRDLLQDCGIDQADVIYADMLRYVSRMPDDLFITTPETKQRLWAAINTAQGR